MERPNDFAGLVSQRGEQMEKLFDKLLAGAQPGAVFSQPIVSGEYTLITASEVASGGGFGTSDFPNACSTLMGHDKNEQALEFLFFDLSSCVQDDNTPPIQPPPN